jgi:hypothetical protein
LVSSACAIRRRRNCDTTSSPDLLRHAQNEPVRPGALIYLKHLYVQSGFVSPASLHFDFDGHS